MPFELLARSYPCPPYLFKRIVLSFMDLIITLGMAKTVWSLTYSSIFIFLDHTLTVNSTHWSAFDISSDVSNIVEWIDTVIISLTSAFFSYWTRTTLRSFCIFGHENFVGPFGLLNNYAKTGSYFVNISAKRRGFSHGF